MRGYVKFVNNFHSRLCFTLEKVISSPIIGSLPLTLIRAPLQDFVEFRPKTPIASCFLLLPPWCDNPIAKGDSWWAQKASETTRRHNVR